MIRSEGPVVLDSLHGYRNGSNAQVYMGFLINFVHTVVGTQSWVANRDVRLLSHYFTVTDEAFLLLCVECYESKWKSAVEPNLNDVSEQPLVSTPL